MIRQSIADAHRDRARSLPFVWTLPDPQVVHVVEFDLADPQYTIELGFAQARRNYSVRERTSVIAGHYDSPGHDVLAAINASLYSSGITIYGTQANNGNIIDYPDSGWPQETYILQESGEGLAATYMPPAVPVIRFNDGAELAANVLNNNCGSGLAVYTPDWGTHTGSTSQGVEVMFRTAPTVASQQEIVGTITAVQTGPDSVNNEIPANGMVISPVGRGGRPAGACIGGRSGHVHHRSDAGGNQQRQGGLRRGFRMAREGRAAFPENWTYGHPPCGTRGQSWRGAGHVTGS